MVCIIIKDNTIIITIKNNYLEEDLLINPKDYQEAKEGDIVEIFHPLEDDYPRLLLQIKAFKDDLSSKGKSLSS